MGGILDFLEPAGASKKFAKNPSDNPYDSDTGHDKTVMVLRRAFKMHVAGLFTRKNKDPQLGVQYLRKLLKEIMLRRVPQSTIPKAVGVHTEFSKNNPDGCVSAKLPKLRMHSVFCEFSDKHYEIFWQYARRAHFWLHSGGHEDHSGADSGMGNQNMAAWRALHMMSLSVRFCLPLSEWAPDRVVAPPKKEEVDFEQENENLGDDVGQERQIRLEQQLEEDDLIREEEEAIENELRDFKLERGLGHILTTPYTQLNTLEDFANVLIQDPASEDESSSLEPPTTQATATTESQDAMQGVVYNSRESDEEFDAYSSSFEIQDDDDFATPARIGHQHYSRHQPARTHVWA